MPHISTCIDPSGYRQARKKQDNWTALVGLFVLVVVFSVRLHYPVILGAAIACVVFSIFKVTQLELIARSHQRRLVFHS